MHDDPDLIRIATRANWFIAVVLAVMILALNYTPLLVPLLTMEKGASATMAGAILAVQAISVLAYLPIGKKLLDSMSYEKCLAVGLALMTLGMTSIGVAALLPKDAFITVMFVAVIPIGAGFSQMLTCQQTYLIQYSTQHDREQTSILFESAHTVGFGISPLVAGATLSRAGYAVAFFVPTFLMVVIVTPLIFVLTGIATEFKQAVGKVEMRESFVELEQTVLLKTAEGIVQEGRARQIPETPIRLQDLIKDRYVVMVLLGMFLSTTATIIGITTLNPMLVHVHEMQEDKSSLFYAIANTGFVIAAPMIWQIRKHQLMRRRLCIILGFAIMSAGQLMRTGNLGLISDQPQIAWTIVSLILTAFPQAFFSACLYPELFAAVEATEVAQNYEPKNLQVFLAILCVACVGLGQITGAILGGVLTSDKQFSRAYVMVASVLAVFTVTYYCLCGFGTETASVKFEVRGMSSGKRSTGSQKQRDEETE